MIRKQQFIDNKLSLCENNCNYTGYNEENKQSTCDCNIKNKMDTVSEIMDNPVQLSNGFVSNEGSSSSGSSNIISIKCTKALFSKEGLKHNISSYILIIFIIHFLLSILFFIKCGYPLLVNEINFIIKEKEKIRKEKTNNNQIIITQKKGMGKKAKKNKGDFPPKKMSFKFVNKVALPKSNNKNRKKEIKIINKNKSIKGFNLKEKGGKKINIILKNNNKVKMSFNDYELNSLDYNEALLYDKRTYCQYYFSLIKRKNIIFFSFCPFKDYNSIIIRTCIFSISFSIHYAINFAFFDDKIMHTIYAIGGIYDIIYFIPKITISFFGSYYLTNIIKIIFLSERNIFQVRKTQNLSIAYTIADKTKKNLVIKYTAFFVLGLIFLGFFWMLLSSFGAVYLNTQMFIFKNALISFAMSLIYPFFFSIFHGMFRTCSLNSKQKNKECIYKTSRFLQLL